MTTISTLPTTNIWTYKTALEQDLGNSIIPFNASQCYQDFMLFGLPANHIVTIAKVSTFISFVAGSNVSVWVYIAPQANLPVVTNGGFLQGNTIGNVYCQANLSPLLNAPSNTGVYQYGTYKWFSIGAPGSMVTRSGWTTSICTPTSFSAQDIYARFVVTTATSPTVMPSGTLPTTSQITAGSMEIALQYTAF